MIIGVLRVVGAPLLAAIVGGLVVHIAARRRDVENERRRQRVDYLVGAYRTLTRAAHRALSGERAEIFEDALSDVILFGNDDQIRLARETIRSLADRREAPMDALLVSLRNALRQELDLPGDALRQVPVVRITSGTEEHPTPLKLHDVGEVSFEEVAARTGAVLASASSASASERPAPEESGGDSTIPRSGRLSRDFQVLADLSLDIQALRELAHAAPGAAVVTAYGHVAAALKELLAGDGDREPEQHDAPTLARVAANRGLVTDQLVETVQGLAILKDLGRRGGAGTGLSVEQANEYIDLVVAALYVLHVGRPRKRSAAS
jgi:hypothetical protein